MHRRWTTRSSTRSSTVAAPVEPTWAVLASGAAGRHWYADAAPFVFRGGLDRLLGGRGRRWAPPDRPLLQLDDRVGFWRVDTLDPARRRLGLVAHVRAPGVVRLDVGVAAHPDGAEITMTISFAPKGLLGRAYLLADLAAREAVAELTMLDLLTELRLRGRDLTTDRGPVP